MAEAPTPGRRRPPPARLSPQAIADAQGGAREGLVWLGRTPESRASLLVRALRLLARFVCFGLLRFQIRTSGQEHLPRGGYLLVGAAHRGWMDPFVVMHALPVEPRAWFLGSAPSTFTSRSRERFVHKVGGLLPVWRGGVTIDQHVESARAVVGNGGVFVQMPEGTVSGPAGTTGPFRIGWAVIALRTGAPIVPIRDCRHRGAVRRPADGFAGAPRANRRRLRPGLGRRRARSGLARGARPGAPHDGRPGERVAARRRGAPSGDRGSAGAAALAAQAADLAPPPAGPAGPGMTGRLAVLASVFRNPALRRVAGAFLAFSIGEWATWVAVIVYAYGRGGAPEAGFVAFIQLVPSVFMAPAAGTLGDRFSRKRVLLTAYVLQTLAMAAAAIALAIGAPAPIVYALATLTATAITMTRPVQSALLPDVATTPDQLTAANVASGTIEGAGTLLGPALAGVLTAIGGPALVFAVSSVGLFLATLSVLPLARRDIRGAHEAGHAAGEPLVRMISRGFTEIAADSRLRGIVAVFAAASLLTGALDIFYAVLALDVFGLGDGGVGFVGAATGVGLLLGGTMAVSLVGRARLGLPILAAATVFGGVVALVGVSPQLGLTLVLLGIAGIGWQFVYIGIQTMTQRIVADAAMSRVFGVYEALMQGATAVGALAVPVLIIVLGTTGAFLAAGLFVVLVAVLAGPLAAAGRPNGGLPPRGAAPAALEPDVRAAVGTGPRVADATRCVPNPSNPGR